MKDKMVIGYIRISGLDQNTESESLKRQKDLIESYCTAKGLSAPVIISDEGKSGYKSNRPGFIKITELCLAGRVSTVIVHDLSRLSRSVRGMLDFIEEVMVKQGIELVSLKENISTESAAGKAFLAISGVFNQLYRDQISDKMRSCMKYKRDQGLHLAGYVPYGYQLKNKKLIPHPNEQEIIGLMLDLKFNKGYSYREIAKILETKGILTRTNKSTWQVNTIKRIINNHIQLTTTNNNAA